jgi:pyochelin synthetase
VAIPVENNSGNNEIVLFIEGSFTDTTNLLKYLKSKMPYYMIPSKIIQREMFPLNSNSKIDRNLLKKSIAS